MRYGEHLWCGRKDKRGRYYGKFDLILGKLAYSGSDIHAKFIVAPTSAGKHAVLE